MSRVKFNTEYNGKRVEVIGGWDSPLKYYHFTIFNLDCPEEDEDVIWGCLDNFRFSELPKTNEPYKKLLKDMNIEPPSGFWDRCDKKEGNVFYTYTINGTWNRQDIG